MSETKCYRCVNCGEPTAALYKTYGPSVIKLNKCEKCKRVVDKYIEYDPAIVLIELVLVSRQAQRHVLYNTHFKLCWKLLVLVVLLQTYCSWSGAGLLPAALHALCGPYSVCHTYRWCDSICSCWSVEGAQRAHGGFIWEKHFYVHFVATTLGTAVFMTAVHGSLAPHSSQQTVPWRLMVSALTVGGAAVVSLSPALVWSSEQPLVLSLRHALALAYELHAHVVLTTVVYGRPWWQCLSALLVCSCLRLLAVLLMVPALTVLLHLIQ